MEKAGIIKEGVPVLFINRRKDVTDVFMEKAREKNAPVTIIEPDDIKDIVIKDKNIDFVFIISIMIMRFFQYRLRQNIRLKMLPLRQRRQQCFP